MNHDVAFQAFQIAAQSCNYFLSICNRGNDISVDEGQYSIANYLLVCQLQRGFWQRRQLLIQKWKKQGLVFSVWNIEQVGKVMLKRFLMPGTLQSERI